MNIHITINVPAPETEGERAIRQANNMARAIEGMALNKIAYEQARGNPLFANISTWSDYQAARQAQEDQRIAAEKLKRKQMGFWRYHFST